MNLTEDRKELRALFECFTDEVKYSTSRITGTARVPGNSHLSILIELDFSSRYFSISADACDSARDFDGYAEAAARIQSIAKKLVMLGYQASKE